VRPGAAALALAAAAALLVPRAEGRARARAVAPNVEVRGPAGDTLVSATPEFTVVAREFAETGCDVQLRLLIASTVDFVDPVYDATACGDSAVFVPSRPLPSSTRLFWRATATSGTVSASSSVVGPRTSAEWLRLVSPNLPNGTTVETLRPLFVWRAAPIASPPGPWLFTVAITNVANGQTSLSTGVRDTTWSPPFDLESNTSYRWSVTARLPTGDTLRVRSAASFVIVDRNAPLVTLLYQNWPNPFPSAASPNTCVWFDLAVATRVQLEVYDLRGALVKRLIPGTALSGEFGPGRYGRATAGGDSGCDPRFAWDGTDATGRTVSPGVYLVRLRAAGSDATRKMLFRGR
jgi:hypothetical protein